MPTTQETEGLISGNVVRSIEKSTRAQTRATFALVAALTLALGIFGLLGYVMWRVNDNVTALEAALGPHAEQLARSSVQMMNELGGASTSVRQFAHNAKLLSERSTEPLFQSVNQTQLITKRLHDLLQHPTLRLSLD